MATKVDYDYKTFYNEKKGVEEGIKAQVHYDKKSGSVPKPIALAIHGGGYCLGTRRMIPDAQVSYLTRNNFVVVSVDHRLCPNVSFEVGPRGDTIDAYHWCRNQLPDILKKDADINVDGSKVVVFGHSSGAHLALLLGAEEPRPAALLDFYGTLYLDDPYWYGPMNVTVPDFDEEFIAKVYDLPVATEVIPEELPKDPKTGTDVRTAFLWSTIKKGDLIKKLIPQPTGPADTTRKFDKRFPPTFFCLGTEDDRRSIPLLRRAYKELEELGVEVVLSLIEGGHAFDTMLEETDPRWVKAVKPGLDFLISHCQPHATMWANRRVVY